MGLRPGTPPAETQVDFAEIAISTLFYVQVLWSTKSHLEVNMALYYVEPLVSHIFCASYAVQKLFPAVWRF